VMSEDSAIMAVPAAEYARLSLTVYPNPTAGRVQVTGDKEDLRNIEIYDMLGKKMTVRKKILPNSAEMDLTPLSPGLYLIRTERETAKVFKK